MSPLSKAHFLGAVLGFALTSTLALSDSETALSRHSLPQKGAIPSLKRFPHYYGIDPSTLDKFWEKWHLVTTRFRQDKPQIRFVYANPIAWKAITAKSSKYPDGAIFAKIAFSSEPDQSFPTSIVPGQYIRVQVMKKDHKSYADTGGWGYAYFGTASDPLEAPKRQKETVISCYACHRIVEKKDFVFSQPVFMQSQDANSESASPYENKFIETNFASLTELGKQAVEALGIESPSKLKVYAMPLFVGSLGESIGSLGQFTVDDGLPHLLLDEASRNFLLTASPKDLSSCKKAVRFVMTMISPFKVPPEKAPLKHGTVCGGRVVWESDREP